MILRALHKYIRIYLYMNHFRDSLRQMISTRGGYKLGGRHEWRESQKESPAIKSGAKQSTIDQGLSNNDYFTAACAAANRAIGTLNGEHDT